MRAPAGNVRTAPYLSHRANVGPSSRGMNGPRPLPPRKRQARANAHRSGPVAASSVDPRILERAVVREVACPRCGAPAGEACYSRRRGMRASHHLERIHARTAQER